MCSVGGKVEHLSGANNDRSQHAGCGETSPGWSPSHLMLRNLVGEKDKGAAVWVYSVNQQMNREAETVLCFCRKCVPY